jgi:hypothetical protein
MADEDIVIALEPDVTGTTAGDQSVVTKTVDPAEDLAAQFKEAQAERDRERQGREAAERQAQAERENSRRAHEELATARRETSDSRYDTVSSGITAATAEIDAAKKDIRAAAEAGDFDRQADAYDKLARANARMVLLTEAKSELEAQRSRSSDEGAAADTRRQGTQTAAAAPADPVEAFISSRTAPTQQWLRAHIDYVKDPKKNARMTAAHFDAKADGLMEDTAEYFAHINKYLGLDRAANGAGNGAGNGHAQNQQTAIRRPAVPVAPVNSSRGGDGSSPTEVRLSRSEAEAATDGTHVWNYDDPSPQKRFKKGDPIGTQEFARRKYEMTKQGRYARYNTDQ